MTKALVQATLPHSRHEGNEFKRRYGLFRSILSPSKIGLPYGSIPRLLIAWLTTEAVRTKEKKIILGQTLSEFMSELDLIGSSGIPVVGLGELRPESKNDIILYSHHV